MALEILYSEISKDFIIIDNDKLFRINRQNQEECSEVVVKADSSGYFRTRWRGKKYLVHRIIYCLYTKADVDSNLFIDHISGDRSDNSKNNLRLVTIRENGQNKLKHRCGSLPGVSFHKLSKKWRARIEINSKGIHLGLYKTEAEAYKAYLCSLTMLNKTPKEIQEYFNVRNRDKCSSKYKGVCFNKRRNRWISRVVINNKRHQLGYFLSEEEAYQSIVNHYKK